MNVKQFLRPYWELVILDNPIEDIIGGCELKIRRIHHHIDDRWFADPFILKVTDHELTLLVEAFSIKEQKGNIAKIVVDRKRLEITRCHTVLEGKHFSFPFIHRKGNEIWVMPESSQEGCLMAYVYDDQTETCRFEKVLCKEPLTDAIYTNAWGKGLLLSTQVPNQNGHVLGVWMADDTTGAFSKEYEVSFSENIARNAGGLFICQGETYRAAQECNHWYGHAISLQKIKMDNGRLLFDECRRLYHGYGIHTFNTYQGVTVADIKQFRIGWLSSLAYYLHGKTDL